MASENRKDRRVFLIFCALIIAGVLLVFWFHEGVFHSLAHALIVAGILGLTVDHYVKSHLVREAARDIDKYLLGYSLPRELQEKIRDIRDAVLVRREFKCTYTIVPIVGEGKIRLEAELVFEIENITDRIQEYTAELELEKRFSPEVTLMSCESYRDRPQEYRLAGSGWTLNQKPATVEASARKVRLRPGNSYFNYKFRHMYTQTLPEIGSEYFQFDQPYPTIGAEIVVNHPKQFKIHFSSKPKVVDPERCQWSDPKVFLRGEIISVWWRPENE